jgi:hypothetical protein
LDGEYGLTGVIVIKSQTWRNKSKKKPSFRGGFNAGFGVGFNKAKRVGQRKLKHLTMVHRTSNNESYGHQHYWQKIGNHKYQCVDCGAIQYRR